MLLNKNFVRWMQMEVHLFLAPTHKETYQPFMRNFVKLGQYSPDKRIDRLRKELEEEMAITRAETTRDRGYQQEVLVPQGIQSVVVIVLEEVENIRVANDTILHRIKQCEKSNFKGGIHEQSPEGSTVKNVKTLDLYKLVDIEKEKAYLSLINMRSNEQHIGHTVNMDFTWLSRPSN
ncbi:hypothetical protein K7X08_016871 [Anisodus acutangulus]|uniref:Uncharacterized protein n=1 Tax=Anisodus acutangulus TaxID=402998 RepID=A0A9Q1LSB0_9SOLA|nr:hypothetical protein K7X08_016871 [Anisodus acutangulus]